MLRVPHDRRRPGRRTAALDQYLSDWDIRERHTTHVRVPPEHALRLALSMPVAVDPLVRLLLALRGMNPAGSIEQFFERHRFLLLAESRTEYTVGLPVVIGLRSTPLPTGPGEWHDWTPPGGSEDRDDLSRRVVPRR